MLPILRGVALALLLAAAVAPAHAGTLSVTIEQVRSDKGQLVLALFGAGDKQLERREVPARPGEMRVAFENLAPGEYAVRVFHDEDGDGQMKKNSIGFPTEGFAFSNRGKARFGPPGWKSIAVAVAGEGMTQTVAVMRY